MAKKTGKNNAQRAIDDLSSGMEDAKNIAADFLNQLNKGGKQSKAILEQIKKQILGTASATKLSADNMKSLIDTQEKLTDGQRKLADIQKSMAGYDGPRFKAAGLITKELSDQLSLNNLIRNSSEILNDLDKRRQIYSEILNANTNDLGDITWQLVKGNEKLNEVNEDISKTATEMLKLKVKEQKTENRLKDISLQKLELDNEIKSGKGDVSKLEEEYIKLMYEETDLLENSKSLGNERNILQEKQNTLLQEQKSLTELLPELQKKQNNLTDAAAIQSSGLVSTYKLLNDLSNDQATEQGNIAKQMQEVEASAFNVGTSQFRQIDLTDQITDKLSEQRSLETARTSILNENNGLTAMQRQEALDLVEANIRINQEQLKQYQALQKAGEAYTAVNDKAEALRDSMMAPVDSLFGIVPSGLSKMLGLDKIQSEMKDKLFKSISDGFMNAGGGVTGFFSAASSGAATLMTSLAPILPLLLAIAGVVGIAKLFMDADAAVGELSKSLNTSYQEGVKVYSTANDISGSLRQFGVSTSDVTKQMVEMSNVMGINLGTLSTTNAKAKEFLETSTLLSKRYGTTAEENAALNLAAAATGTTMDKMALTVEAMSKDGLVPSGELMKDIGKVSKGVLLSFKGNIVALAKAAKQAKLMGTTLDKMAAAGDSLLNIESSITAQNKARMMLGRNINLDAARYYALQGDTEGLMQEMVKAAGSVEEYDRMSVLQKKALAEAMGMQVSDLDEMMAKQKELETLGISQTKLQEMLNASTKEGFDMEKALSSVTDVKAKEMLKEKLLNEQNLSIQEKLAAVTGKFQTALYAAIKPLLPAIESFANSLLETNGPVTGILDGIKGIAAVLGTVFEISMSILKGAWKPIKFTIDLIAGAFDKISKAVKYIKTDIFGIKDATGEAGKAAEGTSMSMEVIKGIATAIGVIIGGWFLLKGLGKAKDGLSSMYDSAKGIGSSLKDGFKSIKEGKVKDLFSKKKGPVEELSEKKIETPEVDTKGADKTLKNTKSFADRLKSMFKSINDTLKAIFKGIGDMLKNIFNFIKDTVKTISDFIRNVMKDIFKTIKDVAKELTSTLQSLLQNIGDLLNTAIDVIKDVGTNLIGAVGDLLGEVIGVIDSQGTALVEALGNIGNTLAEQVMKIVNTILDGLGQAASKLPNIMGSIGDAIASFFQSLGKVSFAEILKGALVMGILAGTLFLLGKALGTFADVSWEDIGKAAVAMIGLGAAMAVLGAAISFIVPGAVALAVMAGALYLFGKALQEVAEGADGASKLLTAVFEGIGNVIESIGNAIATVITSIATSIATLGQVDAANLVAVGGALVVLGAGLLALTAGEVVNGIASFFGASPVDTLKELETIDGNKMKVTAEGLKSMSDSLTNFGNVNTDPIAKSADALDKFNNQVLKGGLADALNSFLGSDPFAVFTQLAAIDTGKIDTAAKSIALAGTSIELFNQKMATLDDSVADKGDIIASLLNDIADVEYGEIDSLASAIDNLSKSYDSLLASMKNITDDDISRMQQIASATPKDVSGGGLGDTLNSAMSGVKDLASNAISSVGSFFGFGEDEPVQETKTATVATTPITPVMQPVATVNTQPADASQSQTTINNQNNNAKLEGLVRELIAKVEQPVIIKLGEKTVAEMQSAISFRKSYGANVNGYRS